jgi:hypothetical protein
MAMKIHILASSPCHTVAKGGEQVNYPILPLK